MSEIDAYLDTLDAPRKTELERIRKIVTETIPDVQETISYSMPAFKYKGKYLLGFFAFKRHLSIFPTSGPIEALKDKLQGFKLSTGTIQFALENPIPEPLIQEILLRRVADISAS